MWSNTCENQYKETLIDRDIAYQISKLDDLLDQVNDDNTYDANNLVDKLSSIIISAASKSVPFKHAKLTKSYRKNKQKPKWVTKDCLLLRKEVRNLGKKVHKYPNNCELRHAFTNCRKEYNKLRKYLKSNFYNGIAEEINSLSPQNSKNFY